MLEVRRLRLLRDLAAHGTIAATAQACSLTPSAVSQQLSALEREVRTRLFIRDGRRLVLTQAAQVLVEHTERILADLEEAAAGVAALSTTVQGVLRLGTFPTAAVALAAPAIAECRQRYPDLRLRLAEHETPEGLAALRAGHVDLLLVYEYSLLPTVAVTGVDVLPLATEPLLVAQPPDADGRPASVHTRLSELAGESWIAPHSDMALRGMLERACGLAGFSPTIDYTSDDYTVILALAQAGLGVALVPQLAVESVAAELRVSLVAEPELSRTVSVALRRGTAKNPAIRAVTDALREAAAALPLPTQQASDTAPAGG